MWRCEWCEGQFGVPAHRGFVKVCPYCGEADIVEITEDMEECKCCGRLVEKTDINDVCEECAVELYKIWERAVEEVMGLKEDWDFTDAEDFYKDYLKDIWRD